MIRVHKDFSKVPPSLNSKKVKAAFDKNIENKGYQSSDSLYKGKDVKKALDRVYAKKCAYCEKKLLDTHRHVEHYRPKRSSKAKKCDASMAYYWLSFSWDNLMLACAQCNSPKGSCFDIGSDRRLAYKNQALADLHSDCPSFQNQEQPLMINPEQEDPEPLIRFNKDGKIESDDPRMQYTINICQLNRDELIEARIIELNDLMNALKRALYWLLIKREGARKLEFNIFFPIFSGFEDKLVSETEFLAWKKWLWQHIEHYCFEELSLKEQKLLKLAWLKFLEEKKSA